MLRSASTDDTLWACQLLGRLLPARKPDKGLDCRTKLKQGFAFEDARIPGDEFRIEEA